jgi:hypothetical protein
MLFSLQYGLQSAFSEIERLEHEVTSSGNPISLTMKTRYKVKGIGMEQTISSVVNIFHDGGKITKVQDKWNGKLPDGAIANVSYTQLLNPPGGRIIHGLGCFICGASSGGLERGW